MSDPIATINQNQTLILLAEIAASLHDLGKLGEQFVADKAEKSTQLSFAHHLVLRRTSTGVSTPPTVSPQDIAKFQQEVQLAVEAWQRDLPANGVDEQARAQAKRALIEALTRAEMGSR